MSSLPTYSDARHAVRTRLLAVLSKHGLRSISELFVVHGDRYGLLLDSGAVMLVPGELCWRLYDTPDIVTDAEILALVSEALCSDLRAAVRRVDVLAAAVERLERV